MSKHYIRIQRGGNRVAVCFIHGILGSYKDTWGNFPHLITQDSRLAHCDVICWGYPSDLAPAKILRLPFIGSKMPDITTVAKCLHTELCNEQIGGNYKDLILMAS